MRFFVGTSGYSYPKWKGSFYPERLPRKKMLSHYAQHFSTVEANNTFRRMPEASVFESWSEQVPASFRFALKAPQIITHFKRLNNVEAEADHLLRTARVLKRRLGPLLFQLPPNFKKDVPRLRAFLRLLGKGPQAAFEFRHPSWFDDEVFESLRAKSCALCLADNDDGPTPQLVSTAAWGYIRLRRKAYTKKRLAEWLAKVRSQPWNEAYIFFKHEDTGTGPKFAARFLALSGRE